jgi:hypothetical protein
MDNGTDVCDVYSTIVILILQDARLVISSHDMKSSEAQSSMLLRCTLQLPSKGQCERDYTATTTYNVVGASS